MDNLFIGSHTKQDFFLGAFDADHISFVKSLKKFSNDFFIGSVYLKSNKHFVRNVEYYSKLLERSKW